VKRIKIEFYTLFIGSISFFAGLVFLYIYLLRKYPNSGYVYASLFLVFLVSLFLLTYLQVRFEYITSKKNQLSIMMHPAEPLERVRTLNLFGFIQYLLDNEFKRFVDRRTYSVYYRSLKDPVRKTRRRKLLEIVVIIDEIANEFYLEGLDEDIEKIKEKALLEKVKFDSIIITQYRMVREIDEKTKEQLKENIFLKNRYGVYSVINIALDDHSKKAVFLYSTEYTPSLYYKYQIEEISKAV
jgi:type II secretory pathway component GspD/PulD (secretin)